MLTSIAIMFLLSIVIGGIFKKIHMRDSVKLIIILSISFLFLEAEDRLEGIVPVSGLLAVMSTAVFINRKYPELAKRLSDKYNKLWVAAEIVLFVLVGATVNLKYAAAAGIGAVVLILGALVFRTIGVQACLIKTPLTKKGAHFLFDCIYSKSNRSGGYRLRSACNGSCLRRTNACRCRSRHSYHRSAWFILHRFDIQKTA